MGKTTLQQVLAGPQVQGMINAQIAAGIDEALAGRVQQIALSEARRHVKRLGTGGAGRSMELAEAVQSRRAAESRTEAVERWNALVGAPRDAPKSTALELLESLGGPRESAPEQLQWRALMARRGVSQAVLESLGGPLLEAPVDAEDSADGRKDEATEDMPTIDCVKCSRKVRPTASKRCPTCHTNLAKAIALTAANPRHPLRPKDKSLGGAR
jgi:hypothetical protein